MRLLTFIWHRISFLPIDKKMDTSESTVPEQTDKTAVSNGESKGEKTGGDNSRLV